MRDIMSTRLVTVKPSATVRDAARAMVERGVGSVLVVDDAGSLVGIVSEGNFVGQRWGRPFSSHAAAYIFGEYLDFKGLQETYEQAAKTPVQQVMTMEVVTVTPDANLDDVVTLMLERDLKRLPVVESNRLVGVVARHDLLKAMIHPKGA